MLVCTSVLCRKGQCGGQGELWSVGDKDEGEIQDKNPLKDSHPIARPWRLPRARLRAPLQELHRQGSQEHCHRCTHQDLVPDPHNPTDSRQCKQRRLICSIHRIHNLLVLWAVLCRNVPVGEVKPLSGSHMAPGSPEEEQGTPEMKQGLRSHGRIQQRQALQRHATGGQHSIICEALAGLPKAASWQMRKRELSVELNHGSQQRGR
mmetsp:Transcript_15599/g.36806  ORF Transcript_15599/g.36806 Transcript_15599/m.36806 type:complete len:206 (+) Transcript_15599:248-865(+)